MIELSVSMFGTLMLIRAHSISSTVVFLLSHNHNTTDETVEGTSIYRAEGQQLVTCYWAKKIK